MTREQADLIAERIVKGLTVTGFENDPDAAAVLARELPNVSATIWHMCLEFKEAEKRS